MTVEEHTEPNNFLEAFLCGRISSKEKQMLQQLKSQIDFADQMNTSFFGGAEIERDIERRENIRINNFDYIYQAAINRLNVNLQNKYFHNTEFRERQKLYFSSVTIFNNETTILKWYLGIEKNVNLEEQKNKDTAINDSRNQEVKEATQNVYVDLEQELGREATHEDLVKDFISMYGKSKTKELLNVLEQGSKLLGKQVTDSSHLFNILTREQRNIQLLKGVLFAENNDDQSILEISSIIFREALDLSNKDMTFEYITNPENIFNDSSVLDYAGLFRALRSTISQHATNPTKICANDRDKVAVETYKTLISSITHSINKI